LTALVLSIAAAMSVMWIAPARVVAAPNFITLSYYMANQNTSSATHRGCADGHIAATTPGTQEFVVILLFGAPASAGGGHGTTNWAGPNYTLATIQSLSLAFAQGFIYCSTAEGDAASAIRLVASTSNDSATYGTTAHGTAFGQMVMSLQAQFQAQSWASRAGAFPGADIEPGFAASPVQTRNWVNAVRTAVNPRSFVSNPSADGCPTAGPVTNSSPCNNGWTMADVLLATSRPQQSIVVPVPQIYNNAMDDQWYWLSKLQVARGEGRIQFRGVMTQYRALQQNGASGFLPTTGFNNLQNRINLDAATALTIPPVMMDVRWANLSNPDGYP
jgi:hypothetical protein